MDDAVATNIATSDRIAADAQSVDHPDPSRGMALIEAFTRRIGRPLPSVLVMGSDLALRCMQLEIAGAAAVGYDAAPNVIRQAARIYPQGSYHCADLRSAPWVAASFEGAWAGGVVSCFPHAQAGAAVAALRDALRPGGLLFARLPEGKGESLVQTAHGPIYRTRWQRDEFEKLAAGHDLALLETLELPGGSFAMILRREY